MKKLSPEQAAMLLYAICDYVEKGIEPKFEDIASDVCFAFIRTQLDKDITKYETTCQKRAEAGRKGAAVTNSKKRQETAISANAEIDEKTGNTNNENESATELTSSDENINISETQEQRKKLKKKKAPETEKRQYAEFVKMREQDYQSLVTSYGEEMVTEMIRVLDNYKGSHGKAYKDDYRAILSWVAEKVVGDFEKRKQKGGNNNYGGFNSDIDNGWQGFEKSTDLRKPDD